MTRAKNFSAAQLEEGAKHLVYLNDGETPQQAILRWEGGTGRRGCVVVL